MMSNPATSLPPGFRFHPTDEELILHYLRNRAASTPCPASIIAEVDIYKFDPWDLPGKAMFGDKEWYFFSPRDRKYPNGVRPNRAAGSGYWKATGTDKPIMDSRNEINVGVKKALVFYKGRPPKGIKTNWIMHEYRLTDITNRYRPLKLTDHSMRLDDWVLCRIYKKSNGLSSVAVHPLIMDQEQEEYSGSELNTDDLPPLQGVPQEDVPKTTTTKMTITKSWSISEFLEDYSALSHLYDTQPELPGFTSAPANNLISSSTTLFIDDNENENGSSHSHSHSSVTHHMGTESPAAVTVRCNNPLKRQRSGGEQGFSRQASKISLNQFDAPQYKIFDQQGLLNYHFGLF